MTYLKENWRQVFMILLSLALAIGALLGPKSIILGVIFCFVFAIATIASVFKSRYVQYFYYLASLLSFLYFLLYFSDFYKYIGFAGVTLSSITLLMYVYFELVVGLVARAFFHRPIQSRTLKKAINIAIGLVTAILCVFIYCLVSLIIVVIVNKVPADMNAMLLLGTLYHSLWLFILQVFPLAFILLVLPLAIVSSLIKNWTKWQALIIAIFTAIHVFLALSGLFVFSDWKLSILSDRLHFLQFIILIPMLFSAYYLSKYIQKTYINSRFLVGFD